ncbi:MAG TPA: hypothetical protein VIW69_16270 [Candidatus Elarobacter sp.]
MSDAQGIPHVNRARTWTLSIALLLAAGCGGGGGGGATPTTPPAPAPTPSPAASQFPAASSAATYMLSKVSTSPSNVQYGPNDQDDGGWSELQLPVLQQCGNGALATDCKVWTFSGQIGSAAARSPRTPIVGSRPPTLNFCRDAAAYPSDLGRPAVPVTNLSGTIFSLSYSGTKALPIVTFATRAWTVQVTNSFSATASSASAIGVTPTVTDTPARGWLLFFTWSWPADVLLMPFDINEIQLAAASSPLAIPPGTSAPLGAFDCLARPITATSALGSGFGFSADLKSSSATSAGPELNVPVYTSATPSGNAVLYDDRGATAQTPVT